MMGRPKGSKNKPKGDVAPAKDNVHRVTTFGKGGSAPISSQAVAPEPAPAPDPDPVQVSIPTGPEAESVLAKIAALNERVLAAHEAFTEAQGRAKERREQWQTLAESLQTLIRVSTRKAEMPLFDAEQREADQGRLITAIEAAARAETPTEAAAPAVPSVSAVRDWLQDAGAPEEPPVEALDAAVGAFDDADPAEGPVGALDAPGVTAGGEDAALDEGAEVF
jgi:hypothetical protein